MQTRNLGAFKVGAIGIGCMNLNHAYGPAASEIDGERVLQGALEAGYTLMDTATLYDCGKNEERVGRVLAKHRQRVVLASKCGMAIIPVDGKMQRVIDGRPATLRRECENSLRRLNTDIIDLYYLHRWDKKVPIEDSVGALSDLVHKGTHWSTRSLPKVVGVSDTMVHRVWRKNGLKPHLVRGFKVSRDPEFVEKLEDIVGLYMSPPENALVLCCDEKSQVQALDRTQPGLPMKKGRAATMTHDYKRKGTTTLLAALSVLDGQVIAQCQQRHRHAE